MIADEPKTAGELLENVGYSHSVSIAKPGEIINQKGVKDALFALGFDSDNARRVVAEILNDETVEPQIRLKAAGEVFKINGDYAAEKSFNMTVNTSVDELTNVIQDELTKFRPHK